VAVDGAVPARGAAPVRDPIVTAQRLDTSTMS
jgi:hypothetical protein